MGLWGGGSWQVQEVWETDPYLGGRPVWFQGQRGAAGGEDLSVQPWEISISKGESQLSDGLERSVR